MFLALCFERGADPSQNLGSDPHHSRSKVAFLGLRASGKVGKEFAQFRLWGQIGEKVNFD